MRVFQLFFVRAPALLLVLSLFFSLVFPVPIYAGVSTSSDADVVWVDDFPLPFSVASIATPLIKNTVARGNVTFAMRYTTTQGGTAWVYTRVGSDGHFYMARPNNFVKASRVEFRMGIAEGGGSLPAPGSYTFAWNLNPESGITYLRKHNNAGIYAAYTAENVATADLSYPILPAYTDSEVMDNGRGDFLYVYKNGSAYNKIAFNTFGQYYGIINSIKIVNSRLTYTVFMDVENVSFPISGEFRAYFGPTDSPPVLTTPGASPSTTDIQQNISNSIDNISSSVSQVVSGVSDVANKVSSVTQAVNALPNAIAQSMEPHYNNVLTQLHHITEQLHAFWNQLAAYFNDKLIPQMITDTNRIVDAINSLDLEVDVSLSELTNVLNKNHQEQLDNDNKNHQAQLDNDDKNADAIMNSYDNSSFTSSNQNLSDSLTQYEDEESRLLEQVQGNINNMEYADPFTQLAGPLADLSFFLTGIYTGLGAFNIPIAFSLTLTIALLCIGWYRFRGG